MLPTTIKPLLLKLGLGGRVVTISLDDRPRRDSQTPRASGAYGA
jgi:hypothetical protein